MARKVSRPSETARNVTVLVTGASGQIGAELVGQLCSRGYSVIALVNRVAAIVRNDGSRIQTGSLQERGGGRVALARGNVVHSDLGLSEADRNILAEEVDVVIHSAAITEFGLDKALYDAVNVAGTKNVLRFVAKESLRPKDLIHVSTAYVCGDTNRRFLEADLSNGQQFSNHYEESKYQAEMRIREAVGEGVRAITVRPSIVVGHGVTGEVREFKNIYTVLRTATNGIIRAIPGDYDASLDLISIDYVVEGLVRIVAARKQWFGKTFHLVNGSPITLGEFSEVLSEYPSLFVPRFVPRANFDLEGLPATELRYHKTIVRHYYSYFRRKCTFDQGNALQIMPDVRPRSGKPLLRKLMNYCECQGYLRPSKLAFSPQKAGSAVYDAKSGVEARS
jgi:thioester reductase-like protein